jgi:hypothetical protein
MAQKIVLIPVILMDRLSYGVMHRLPRVSPDVPLTYKQWIIPAGVSLAKFPNSRD